MQLSFTQIRKQVLTLAMICFGVSTTLAQTLDSSEGIKSPISENKIYYFQVVPSNATGDNAINTLFALSEAPMSTYSDGSVILRFNTAQSDPSLDVYDSDTYIRTNSVAISFEAVYHCWFDINFANETYNTYVLTGGMTSPTLIHADAGFRKSGVSNLTYWNSVRTPATSNNQLIVKHTGLVNAVGDLVPDWFVLETEYGDLDNDNLTINNIPEVSTADFVNGISIPGSTSASLLDGSGSAVNLSSEQLVTSEMTLKISGQETSEYDLEIRTASSGNLLLSAFNAKIDQQSNIISGLYPDLIFSQFITGIELSPFAQAKVLDGTGSEVTSPSLIISDTHKVTVTAENGTTKTYTLTTTSAEMPAAVISDSKTSYYNIKQEKFDLEGSIEWHIKSSGHPLPGSILNLKSEDIWLYFDKIKPQRFNDEFLSHILVNGEKAVAFENIRLVTYGNGCVLISHPKTYTPVTVFADTNLGGESKALDLYTYHKHTSLGTLADNIESFVLKKGYMATFSEEITGTGASKVYIADKDDLTINLPGSLANTVSFVRVFPWRWTTKKSMSDTGEEGNERLGSTWRYNWDNGWNSTLNLEYVPMRHNPNWPSYNIINVKKNVTHALFYNEPDNSVDDGFSSVEDAIAQYPNMLASGLRIGSPAPTDGGLSWLYDFVDQCAAKNYRLDFIAVHFYRGCQSTSNFYNFLNSVHQRTGLPIWVTEWNNGANWSDNSCDPTYESQAETISDWVDMLESAPFVERYAIYQAVEDTRRIFHYDGSFTPAGQVYRDKVSGIAYNPGSHQSFAFPAHEATEISSSLTLSWTPKPGTTHQQLYFGETDHPELVAFLDGHTDQYTMEDLDYNKTYYWRVDEFNQGAFVPGDSLKFSTIAFTKAADPVPADGSTDVVVDQVMSWISDPDKEEVHKLYLGTHPDSLMLEATFLDGFTSFDRSSLNGVLEHNQIYYWRVDEHTTLKGGGEYVATGDIWSFSTVKKVLSTEPAEQLKVYPNPAKDTIYIVGLSEETEIRVYDILGNVVHAQKTKGQIHVEHLSKGIYILKTEGFSPIKIIK